MTGASLCGSTHDLAAELQQLRANHRHQIRKHALGGWRFTSRPASKPVSLNGLGRLDLGTRERARRLRLQAHTQRISHGARNHLGFPRLILDSQLPMPLIGGDITHQAQPRVDQRVQLTVLAGLRRRSGERERCQQQRVAAPASHQGDHVVSSLRRTGPAAAGRLPTRSA